MEKTQSSYSLKYSFGKTKTLRARFCHRPFWDENFEIINLTPTWAFCHFKGKLLCLCWQTFIFKNENKILDKRLFFWLCKRGLKTNFLFPHRVYLKMQPDSRIKHRYQDQLQMMSEMHRTISENKPHHTSCIKPGTARFQEVRWNLEMPLQERKGFCEQEGAPGYLAPYGTPDTASCPTPRATSVHFWPCQAMPLSPAPHSLETLG